jgi:hypothetical protein
VSDDFLRRTAERALGRATVVTPVLASTYQPGAGFGLEAELALATPWLAPSHRNLPAALSRPGLAPAPDEQLPRPSPRESVEVGSAPAPSAPVDPPADPEPTLSPLAPGQRAAGPNAPTEAVQTSPEPVRAPAKPKPVAGVRPPAGAVPTSTDSPAATGEPTLGTREGPRPQALEPDAAPADLPPSLAALRPGTNVAHRMGPRRADRSEPAAAPENEPVSEPTLDAAPAVRTAAARMVAAEPESARTHSPIRPSSRRPAPIPRRYGEDVSQPADDPAPVRVTIGRVEIRGDSTRPDPPEPSAPSGPALPLDEYLRTRGGIP